MVSSGKQKAVQGPNSAWFAVGFLFGSLQDEQSPDDEKLSTIVWAVKGALTDKFEAQAGLQTRHSDD